MKYLNDCDGKFGVAMKDAAESGSRICDLIWGDPLHLTGRVEGDQTEVRARDARQPGWIPSDFITDDGLLEFYIIDVGQGDGVLIRTPDDKWHVIDAGVTNEKQMTKKGAANFIRWKFLRDLQLPDARLTSVVVSHPDSDHYGGLINLLTGDLADTRPTFVVEVETFYHCGMGRFDGSAPLGRIEEGRTIAAPIDGFGVSEKANFIVDLLGDKASFAAPFAPFTEEFTLLANAVLADNVLSVSRLGIEEGGSEWFPGYAPADGVTGPGGAALTVRILGPLIESFTTSTGEARKGLRSLGGDSITRNGHSIVLRFDYGAARILMTGDLNTKSQRLLLSRIPAEEFAVDVMKGCHHGAEDIDMRFLKAAAARATVLSSGDNEDYAHPRPVIMGASAFYGRAILTTEGEHYPPLVYSTELARSVKLKYADRVQVDHDGDPHTARKPFPVDQSRIRAEGESEFRYFGRTPIATDLIYGLVNVRTDGRRILCATMEEKGSAFDIKVFEAGTTPA